MDPHPRYRRTAPSARSESYRPGTCSGSSRAAAVAAPDERTGRGRIGALPARDRYRLRTPATTSAAMTMPMRLSPAMRPEAVETT